MLIGFLLAAVTLILYWPVQSFDFVYDDELYITENRPVHDGLSTEGLKWSFTTFHAGNWHPLSWISHRADFEAYRLNAGGHHWTSVLIHAAGTVLLFLVLSSMTGTLWCSALAAALFAIHPLHVESVAWVAERKDVLSGFFWILTMGAYAYYVKSPTIRPLSPGHAVICPGPAVEADARDASLCAPASRLLAPWTLCGSEDRLRRMGFTKCDLRPIGGAAGFPGKSASSDPCRSIVHRCPYRAGERRRHQFTG